MNFESEVEILITNKRMSKPDDSITCVIQMHTTFHIQVQSKSNFICMAHDHIQDTLIYIISFDPQIIISTVQIKKKRLRTVLCFWPTLIHTLGNDN